MVTVSTFSGKSGPHIWRWPTLTWLVEPKPVPQHWSFEVPEFWSKHDGLLWSELIGNFFQFKKCHWNFPWLVPLVSTLQRCPLMDFLRSFLSFLTIFWCLRMEVRAAWENSQHFVTPPVVSLPNDLWTQACSDFNNNNYTCQLFLRYKREIFTSERFLSWECWNFWRWHDHFQRFPKKSDVFRRRPKSTEGEVIEKTLIHKDRR